VLALSGSATQAAWQAALRSVTYSSSSEDPTGAQTTADRTVSFVINDGTGWGLAMNIHPSDGHNFGWGNGWSEGINVGSVSTALNADYMSAEQYGKTAGYISIVRHNNGACEASKVSS
jgi:hypothetical protein